VNVLHVGDGHFDPTEQGRLHPAIRESYDAVQPGGKPIEVVAAAEEICVLRDRRNRLINPAVRGPEGECLRADQDRLGAGDRQHAVKQIL